MGRCKFGYALVVFILGVFSTEAQQNRYMIFFKDKEGVSQSLSEPITFLSEKAIERRIEQGIQITAADLPVSRAYVKGVRETGADTFFTTRWMNGVLVQCEPALLPSLEALPYVARVEFVAPLAGLENGGRRSFNLRRKSNHTGVETENQLRMLGIDLMHQADIRGAGVTIAVLDSGFPGVDAGAAFHNVFSEGRILERVSYDFVHNSTNVFQYDDHGTEVLSVIAAEIPDAYTGGAPEASFQLFITEDVPTEYRIEEYNWLFAAERADSAGVDIIHSSLGYYDFDDQSMNYTREQMDGETAVVTQAAQWAADRGIVVVTSAGNEGNIASWRIITAPADAEGVIAVGGVTSTGQKTSSSSIGPTADNRIKPDVVALGTGVKVVKANGQISTSSGTSLAAPLVTSLVAGVMQRYPELGSEEVIALLHATSSQAKNPDDLLGYGIPNFQAIVNFQERTTQTRPFEIYPNPLKEDTLTISPYDPEVIDSCQVEIISSQGQLVRGGTVRFDWLNRTYQADLSAMAPGVYFVRIYSEKRRHTFKLVKL